MNTDFPSTEVAQSFDLFLALLSVTYRSRCNHSMIGGPEKIIRKANFSCIALDSWRIQ